MSPYFQEKRSRLPRLLPLCKTQSPGQLKSKNWWGITSRSPLRNPIWLRVTLDGWHQRRTRERGKLPLIVLLAMKLEQQRPGPYHGQKKSKKPRLKETCQSLRISQRTSPCPTLLARTHQPLS